VLSGLTEPTHGSGFAFGLDVRADMHQLRSNMGSCPQDDVLWPMLTAREQLRICCALKGVAAAELEAEVDRRLEQVSLTSRGDSRVGGFSGGMKRRLSVAMAAVASPKLIFLDEPTTGMDPLSRRRVWDMIEKLKEGTVVLLTTHSMEEADVLGDKVMWCRNHDILPNLSSHN
jgi:ABC-type multidrug transport system ATPase subunit